MKSSFDSNNFYLKRNVADNNKRNVNFKGMAIVDIGTANGGTFANATITYSGEQYPNDHFKKDEVRVPSDDTDTFISSLNQNVNYELTKHGIVNGGRPKEPTDVLILLPGAMSRDENGNQICTPPNIKGSNGKSIADPTYGKPIVINSITEGMRNFARKVVVLNDGALHLANMYKCLVRKHPESLGIPERKVLGVFVGGGFGVGEINTTGTNGEISLVPTENGHLPMPIDEVKDQLLLKEQQNKMIDVEEYAVGAPALIRNYAKALGFNDKNAKKLRDTKNAKFVTQYPLCLDPTKKDEKQEMEDLDYTGLFDKIKISGKKYEYTLINPKTGNPVSREEHKAALKTAGREFFRGIGVVLADYVKSGHTDTLISSTKLSYYLSNTLKSIAEKPEEYPEEIIKKSAWKNLDDQTRSTLQDKDKVKYLH